MPTKTSQGTRFRQCVTLAGLFVCSVAAAQIPDATWPDYMPLLQPGPSSHVAANTPVPDAETSPPNSDVPDSAVAFSGVWTGWAGANRVVDLKMVVKSMAGSNAAIRVIREVDGHPRVEMNLDATLHDGEIRAIHESGTVAYYRLRSPDVVELLWQSSRGSMTGILSKVDSSSTRSIERVPTPFVDNGTPVTLEAVIHTPNMTKDGSERFPVLVFNHGSTGDGKNPGIRKVTFANPVIAKYFTQRGWMVVFPQRRGRGKSDGKYEEGLQSGGVGYSLETGESLRGFDHATEDLDAVVAWLKSRSDVDPDKMIISGHSRGGALAIGYVGTNPGVFKGAINFVGGWLSDSVETGKEINETIFTRGAAFPNPTLWLYAKNDPFYKLSHSRGNHKAFRISGGQGDFVVLPVKRGTNGHNIDANPALWGDAVDDYLELLKLK